MVVAIVMAIVVVLSVLFHFFAPWQFDDIASNWDLIDLTVDVTFWICGVAFVLLGAFMSLAIYRFKYDPARRSAYEPENPKLEIWLTTVTTLGVVGMLAPGLVAWDDYVRVPPDAMEVEVLGEQWDWKFRLPGEDGVFGAVDNTLTASSLNPLGMKIDDPETGMKADPYGFDDIIIPTDTIHVPIDRNVKIVMRAKDVLHDFWVPRIRAKMDLVPGMVTYFWFRPTETGKFEILCAELCGRAHHAMRGWMYIDTEEDYAKWLDAQLTWGEMLAGRKPEEPIVTQGRLIAESNGCLACHTQDGSASTGPTWLDLWGREVTMSDGTIRTADELYIRKSIEEPAAELVDGYPAVMIPYQFSDEDMTALLRFLQEIRTETDDESTQAEA